MSHHLLVNSRLKTGAKKRKQLAAALLLLSSCVLLVWSSALGASLPTPTPTPGSLRLHTPTPERRILLPYVTSAPAPRQTPGANPTLPAGVANIRVDTAQRFQPIDGFGATHLSLVYDGGAGDVLPPALRAQAIDAVYGQVGINLGNLEAALLESPGTYEQRANDNDDPDTIAWSGFQDAGPRTMRPALLDRAVPLGFTAYFPAQKLNVRWASPWLADLRSSDYSRYLAEAAEQVEAGMRLWRTGGINAPGITPRLLMLFNEPLSGNAELSGGTTREIVELVKTVADRLRSQGFADVRFVAPNEETVQKTIETAGALLADPAAKAALGAVGYHPYPYGSAYASIPKILATSGRGAPDEAAVAERRRLASLLRDSGLPLWMTEVSHGEVDPLSFDSLRGRAIHIHDEFLYAGASAYFGMNNMWDSESQRIHFGNSNLFDPSNEGNIVLIDSDAGRVHITGMGYAIGHYARWLQPGMVRVGATSSDPLVKVTAMVAGGAAQPGTLVLVLINNAPSPRSLQIDVSGMALAGSLSGEHSTAAAAWQPLAGVATTSSNQLRVDLPAYSITTLSTAR